MFQDHELATIPVTRAGSRSVTWPYLHPGDAVSVVAPASYVDPAILPHIEAFLRDQHWDPQLDAELLEHPHDPALPFAQTHAMRGLLLYQALLDPGTKAVLFIRGGYGVAHALEYVHTQPAPSLPKMIVGFSDATALHLYAMRHWGWPSLHAEMLWRLVKPERPESIRNAWVEALSGRCKSVSVPLISMNPLAEQKMHMLAALSQEGTDLSAIHAAAPSSVTGTNLALLTQSIGTFWEVDTVRKVLLVEDDKASAESIHRSLTHLLQAGKLHTAEALVIGSITHVPNDDTDDMNAMLQDIASMMPCPVFRAVDFFGHDTINHVIPLGTDAYLYPCHQLVIAYPGHSLAPELCLEAISC